MTTHNFDFVTDRGEHKYAVSVNGTTAAKRLGYDNPNQTQIAKVAICHGDTVVSEIEIGEGKYLSAIWIEAWLNYRDEREKRPEKVALDRKAIEILKAYMGERVRAEARATQGEKHGFVYAILSATEPVTLLLTWK